MPIPESMSRYFSVDMPRLSFRILKVMASKSQDAMLLVSGFWLTYATLGAY